MGEREGGLEEDMEWAGVVRMGVLVKRVCFLAVVGLMRDVGGMCVVRYVVLGMAWIVVLCIWVCEGSPPMDFAS
ncbi:hypothetical protein [Bartonella sp. MM73XJBT.G]|uniref:hypothetical protein n=1 Tax=Bartonella sp. MM73XJBT.G TaxID=3019097 RepID=UPI00235F5C3E|nr:hypothetical protein [Bartonella sp. MM73XJBT.G]